MEHTQSLVAFLAHILPAGAPLYTVVVQEKGGRPKHLLARSPEEMAMMSIVHNAEDARTVYYAMAGFKQGWHKVPGRDQSRDYFRVRENVHSLKSFWVDIDVSLDPAKDTYRSKQEALEALNALLLKTGFPTPLVVESLNGFHCYWVTDTVMTLEEWLPLAEAFKAMHVTEGFKVDGGCTADAVRILRPPYTHNKKDNNQFFVTVFNDCPPVVVLAEFKKLLKIKEPEPDIERALSLLGLAPVATSFETATTYSAAGIIAACNQLATCGSGSYQHWFHSMSVFAKCEDGREQLHLVSKGDARYDVASTDAAFERALADDYPPTLCSTFKGVNPAGCEGCPHAANVSSPLHIRIIDVPEHKAVPDASLLALASPMMREYEVIFSGDNTGVTIVKSIPTRVGKEISAWVEERTKILDQVLIPLQKVEKDDGTSILFWRELDGAGAIRDHAIDNAQLTFESNLEVWLRDCSIEFAPKLITEILHYMKTIWSGFMKSMPTIKQTSRLGWFETSAIRRSIGGVENVIDGVRGFAIGDRNFWANKNSTELLPSAALEPHIASYSARGTEAKWRESIEQFDKPDFLWAQVIMALVCGGVMAKWLGGNDGLPFVYVYSKNSGQGKSTAMAMAMAMYGDPRALKVGYQTSVTTRIGAVVGANNIPTFHDELTKMPIKQVEDLLMALSQNREKDRSLSSGARSDIGGRTWNSIAMGNGNEPFAYQLADESRIDLAALARIIQVDINHIVPDEAANVRPDIRKAVDLHLSNYGVAGRRWAQWLLDDLDNNITRLHAIHDEVIEEFSIVQSERMWASALALIKFGATAGVEAQVHPYSWERIKPEVIRWLDGMRLVTRGTLDKHEEWFAMLQSFITPGLLRCSHRAPPDPRNPIVHHTPRVDEVARFSPIARINEAEQELAVPVYVLRVFCKEFDLEYTKVLEAWEEAGYVIERGNYRIASHTSFSVSAKASPWCIFFTTRDSDSKQPGYFDPPHEPSFDIGEYI